MRCKSCDAELSSVDLKRRDPVDDSFVDLCTSCYGASEHHRYQQAVVWEETHEDVEDAPEAPMTNPEQRFADFVEKHNLMASWADGLGLKWTPEQRQAHFYAKCYSDFLELYESGYGTVASLERACDVHRANRRREYSGASWASMYDSDSGGMHDTQVVDYFGGETPTDFYD